MSTTNKQTNKSAASSGTTTVGAMKNQVGSFNRGFKVLSVLGAGKKPAPTKLNLNMRKYPDSPTRNAKKAGKNKDIDIKVCRDLKYEFQSGFSLSGLKGFINGINSITGIDTDRINEAMNNLSEIDVDTANAAFAQMRDSAGNINILTQKFMTHIEQLNHDKEQFLSGSKSVTFASSIVIGVSAYLHYENTGNAFSRSIMLVAVVIALATAPDEAKTVITSSITSLMKVFSVSPQSYQLPITSISTMLSCMITGMSVAQGRGAFVSRLSDGLAHFDRKSQSLEAIVKFVSDTLVSASNAVLEYLGYEKLYTYADTGDMKANSFVERYMEIVKEQDMKIFGCNEDNFRRLIILCDEAQDLMINLKRSRDNEGLIRVITNIHSKLMLQKEIFLASNFDIAGVRMEPVCIVLKGGPGVGKSQTAMFLHAALCSFALPEAERENFKKDPTKYMFNRQPENVYWDGYDSKQIVTLIDDFGQIRDVAGNPDCEYMNAIRMINEFPAMLHTAAMEKKSHTFFRSEFVILTTNVNDFRPESINSRDALTRRFHLTFDVSVKEEFATNGQIDSMKLPIVDGQLSSTPDILTFTPFDYNTLQADGPPVSFGEMVDAIHRRWLMHKQRHSGKIADLARFSESFGARYEGGALSRFVGGAVDDAFQLVHDEVAEPLINEIDSIWENGAFPLFDDDFKTAVDPNAYREMRTLQFWSKFSIHGRHISSILKLNLDYLSVPTIDEYFKAQGYQMWAQDLVMNTDEFYERLGDIRPCRTHIIPLTWFDWDEILLAPNHVVRGIHSFVTRILRPCFIWCTFAITNGMIFAGMIHGIHFVEKKYKAWKEPTIEVNDSEQQSYTMKKPHGKQLKKSDFREMQRNMASKATDVKTQSFFNADPNGSQIVAKIVARNMYRISMFMGKTVEKLGYGIFLRGTVMLIPAHFVLEAASAVKIDPDFADYNVYFELATVGETNPAHKFEMTCKDMIVNTEIDLFDGRDLALLTFPVSVPMHQDIVKYFLSSQDYERIKDWNVRLYLPRADGFENHCSQGIPITTPILVHGSDLTESRFLTEGMQYIAPTTKGDCGGLLVCGNSKLPRARLLGVHVAGDSSKWTGYTSTVTREELTQIFADKDQVVEDFESDDLSIFVGSEFQSRFKPLYKAKLKHNAGMKSAIVKSPMYSYLGHVKTAPSVLRPVYREIEGQRVLVDPYKIAVTKYCTANVTFDRNVVRLAKFSVFENLRENSTQFDAEVFDFDTAVCGLVDNPYFSSMNRGTSAGYPYSSMNLGRGKFFFFGAGNEYDLTTQQAKALKENVENVINKAKNNIRLEHIFTDNLKDERRTLEKVKKVSTRLFSGAPIEYTIAFRMYFGSFMAWYISNHIKNGSAIGVNVYSLDWDSLAKKMLTLGSRDVECCGAGDYSKFDGSEKPALHWAILDIINDFYNDGPDNCRIRRVLWHDLVNSKHIRDDEVVAWPSSLPSGHPCTTIVNNLYNHMAFNMCWLLLGLPSFGPNSFYRCVYLCVLGDDNIYSVRSDYREAFSEYNVSQTMVKLGLTYTSEIKGEISSTVALRKITDISFLKRTFKWDKQYKVWIAPLDLDVILDMPNWSKNNPELYKDICRTNVETALMELSLHGQETFDKYATCMISAYLATGLPNIQYTTYLANYSAVRNRLNYL